MVYTVCQNWLQIVFKIICLPYLTSTGIDGSGFIGFDEEMPHYFLVFKYGQGSQQEASSRKVHIPAPALSTHLGVSIGCEREGSATQKSSLEIVMRELWGALLC